MKKENAREQTMSIQTALTSIFYKQTLEVFEPATPYIVGQEIVLLAPRGRAFDCDGYIAEISSMTDALDREVVTYRVEYLYQDWQGDWRWGREWATDEGIASLREYAALLAS